MLQTCWNRAVTWADIWKMFFNLIKCHHLHIGKNPNGQSYTMQPPQETITIESVDSEKDNGVIIDKSLSFGEHKSSKISIANRNLGLIFRTFTFMDKDMFLNLYKSLVRPHLEYATSLCGHSCTRKTWLLSKMSSGGLQDCYPVLKIKHIPKD